MTRNEFIEISGKLEKYYGKEYTPEQLSIMYEELHNMPIDRYERCVRKALQTCKFLPKIADIIEVSKSEQGMNCQEQREKIPCSLCNGTGYITYWETKDDRPYEFVAICKCGNRPQYIGWELSEPKDRTNYYTPMAQELGLI